MNQFISLRELNLKFLMTDFKNNLGDYSSYTFKIRLFWIHLKLTVLKTDYIKQYFLFGEMGEYV